MADDADSDVKQNIPAAKTGEATATLASQRELELKLMVKERDEHLARLVNQIKSLRLRLPQTMTQASIDDPISLPPSVTNLILPLLTKRSSAAPPVGPSGQTTGASATVTGALTARLTALQQENDELYLLLKKGTVGRLHEEVRELRSVTKRLEGALKESHTIISGLKTDLEQAYLAVESRRGSHHESKGTTKGKRSRSRSPVNHYQQQPQHMPSPRHSSTTQTISSRPIPTGPRALKKPRLGRESHSRGPSHHPSSQLPLVGDGSYHNGGRESTAPRSARSRSGDRSFASTRDDKQHYSADYDDRRSRSPDLEAGSPVAPWRRSRTRTMSPPGRLLVRSNSRSRSRSPARSPREFSYSPDPKPSRPVQRRTPTPSLERTRSRTRSPMARSPKGRRKASRSPPRTSRSRSRSPKRRPLHSPSPPPRRSRSPSRLRHHKRESDRSPRPLRRDREPLASPTGPAARSTYRSPMPEKERERERDRERAGRRKRGQRNGNGVGGGGGGHGRHGAASSSTPGPQAAASLASRIK